MTKRKLDRAEAIKVFLFYYLFTKFSLMMYAVWLEIIELNLKFHNVYILLFIFEIY